MNEQTIQDDPGGAANEPVLVEGASPQATGTANRSASRDFYPTAEAIEREIESVVQRELSPELQSWVDRYEKVGHRETFLWKWCHRGVEVTTLPCVRPECREELYDTKVIGVMLDVLLDDIADEAGDPAFLEHLLCIPFSTFPRDASQFSPEQQAYARFTENVWDEIQRRVRRLPRFEEFADQLQFDYLQLYNVMRYSRLLNANPDLLNLVEHDLYLPHNMHMMVSATIDMMSSPDFDRTELGRLREAVWYAQCMGRVGNLVTTWQRELDEGDFTSGVFAHAVCHGELCVDDFDRGRRSFVASIIQNGGHEGHFLRRWQAFRVNLLCLQPRIQSVDLRQLITGLERLICLHLGSRGMK